MRVAVNNPLDGTVFDDRYRLDRVLARGGMSTVYVGTDLRLDRTVAIKVMGDGLNDDPVFVRRFSQEARAAARLSHPNVVAVYDQGSDAGRAYLVMELVAGRTLRDLLHERGRLSPELATSILVPVLSALAAAHRAGLVHRDVKPENILLGEASDPDSTVVKVADFGLARAIASAATTHGTATGAVLGTVSYVAPEQVANGVTDPRTDVYSAGIVLYEMLTGHPPYVADNPISVAYRHVHDDVPPPSASVPGLPEELDAITARATRREPGARPVDAGAFLAELRDVVSDLGLRQVPIPTPSSAAGPSGRHNTSTLSLAPPPYAGGQPLPVRPLPPDPEFRPAEPKVRNPEQRRHRRHFLIAMLVILLLGMGVAAAGWWYGSGRYTSVPKMSMLTVKEARQAAKSAHLKVEVSPNRQHSEDVPAGEIVSTSPGGGKKALRGSTVELQLSAGPERYTVPDKLVGLDKAVAQRKLSGMPLSVEYQHAYSDTVAVDHVVRVSPAAGTSLRRGQTVTLVLSRGPKPFPVPDETGNPVTAAATALRSAGLHVTTTREFSSTVESGHVISQDPASGDVKRGDTVQLVVSKGPQMVRVPDVTRESIEQATHDLQAAGFKVSVQSYFEVFGEVVQTKPGAGAMAPKGSTIQIIAV